MARRSYPKKLEIAREWLMVKGLDAKTANRLAPQLAPYADIIYFTSWRLEEVSNGRWKVRMRSPRPDGKWFNDTPPL